MNRKRVYKLMKESIAKMNLDLSGLTILTEAATGYFALTPIIAALSGANKVYALTRNSNYGTIKDVKKITYEFANEFDLKNRIEVIESRVNDKLKEVDIVTNLGFVRPIDKEIIQLLKKTVVISLMFEPWEFRNSDIDLTLCRQLGIPIFGTNENSNKLKIFDYIGPLAVKLALELDVELFSSKVIIIGGGVFGNKTQNVFKRLGSKVTWVNPDKNDKLTDNHVLEKIQSADLLVFADLNSAVTWIGKNGQLKADELVKYNPSISIAHIAGKIEMDPIIIDYRLTPRILAKNGFMSITTAYLGPKPIIDLHTGGLKVGEVMAKATLMGKTGISFKKYVLKNSPALELQC